MNYCTLIPSGRISEHARLELRLATDDASSVRMEVVRDSGQRTSQVFVLRSGRERNQIYPCLQGITGKIWLEISFLDAQGSIQETLRRRFEIVPSPVASTRLLDGCWVSLYHWSEEEARWFQPGLKKLTEDGWRQQVHSMHKLGVTAIVIQNVFDSQHYANCHSMTADSYDGRAFYASSFATARMPIGCEDPIEAILSAADECGMAVFPGVGLYAWFDFSPESLLWHKRVTQELYARYGHHSSFYGWYISEEIWGSLYFEDDAVPDEKYLDIRDFFREYQMFVHQLTPTKPVALASNNIHMHLYPEQWHEILQYLDILIPFAFARSAYNLAEIAEMCARAGTHFWVDMEIFANPFADGLRPKSCPELIKEIRHYDPVEQIYGYQFTGLMNEPGHRMDLGGEDTEELYTAYLEYVRRINPS